VVASSFWFMILFTWIGLLMAILGDLFPDHELSGRGKALWTPVLIVAPWLGAVVYLIVRGRSINERARAQETRPRDATAPWRGRSGWPRACTAHSPRP
jgi:hypothetical protein